MGSSQSLLSPEAVITALVVAGAVGLGYQKINARVAPTSGGGGGAKKDKKKKRAPKVDNPPVEASSAAIPTVVAFPAVIPGGFETADTHEDEPAGPKPKKAKKKKAKSATPAASTTTSTSNSQVIPPPAAAGYNSASSVEPSQRKAKRTHQTSSSSSQHNRPLQSSISIDTDGSWTRVESGHRSRGAASTSEGPSAEVTTSDAGITTPVTGNSSPLAERTEDEGLLYSTRDSPGNRRTLAEKMLPKPRKTGVDELRFPFAHNDMSCIFTINSSPSVACLRHQTTRRYRASCVFSLCQMKGRHPVSLGAITKMYVLQKAPAGGTMQMEKMTDGG